MLFATLSIIFSALFLGILFSLHFLKRELDPSWRMISEYEIGRFGWLMRIAFFCWGASVLALLIALWPHLQPLAGSISRGWLLLIVLALLGAGLFKTDPITALTSSTVNRLHTLCGAIVILTFPIAATLAVSGLLHEPVGPAGQNMALFWINYRGWLISTTLLTWLGMVVYFGSVILARVRDPRAGSPGGPVVHQGWPNRFMVVTYLVWNLVLAVIALKL